MGFLDNFKYFKDKLDYIESNYSKGSTSLLEVYERNAKLEEEIKQRTRELDRANKQMLTLQHIFDMMNASKPLSSVLNTIVNSLQGELGYLYSFMIEYEHDANSQALKIVASSRQDLSNKFHQCFNCDVIDYYVEFPNIPELNQAIINNNIYQSTDTAKFICCLLPTLEHEKVQNFLNESKMKSYILIPLISKSKHFGSLVVFSSRENVSDNEINFLSIYAKQIELAITIADLFQAVKSQAMTDAMTGLYNRRYFEEFLNKEAIRSQRQNIKFSVIGLDLDHLKQINDNLGHNYGDLAIKTIADILKTNARSIDIVARMGGEEFNIILPGIDSKGAMVAAERLRKAIASVELDKIGHITASLGVATYLEHTDDINDLLEITDRAMYESKMSGRNRVSIAKPITEISWKEIAVNTFADILSKHRIPLDDSTYDLLINKLKEMNINNDKLYQVADTLVSTYNPEHVEGVVKQKVLLASLLAKHFELDKVSIDKLKIAILLYDIGNTMLPKDLLNKKEPLTDDEKNSIKQHPVLAARKILEPISCIVDIIPIIEKHHENWNGTGYPNKIIGNDIPIESQIILIIDSYFALLENRPYRSALNKEDAINLIKQDINKKWSEELAIEFITLISHEN